MWIFLCINANKKNSEVLKSARVLLAIIRRYKESTEYKFLPFDGLEQNYPSLHMGWYVSNA